MSQYFIDKLVYNNDTLDIHDTEAREMINTNTTNIQALSARVTKNANDIDALENTTNVIREDLDNVEDRVSVTEAEIDGLTTRTTSLEGKMVTVENRLDGHDTKISNLEGRMDTAENNITALDGRMTTAENDIDAAEHRLDLVEAKNNEQDTAIDTLEANVAKNTADIVDIKADLTGIHTDINDLDDRITASTYEAGIGIYFGQGAEHTNINVDDEILNQINQNTIDIQNLKTRVTNVENRLTVVEGDITDIKGDITNIKGEITDIKGEIVNIKADITALTVRVTALEQKVLPAGGTKGQVLKKRSDADYDVEWVDEMTYYQAPRRNPPTPKPNDFVYPGDVDLEFYLDVQTWDVVSSDMKALFPSVDLYPTYHYKQKKMTNSSGAYLYRTARWEMRGENYYINFAKIAGDSWRVRDMNVKIGDITNSTFTITSHAELANAIKAIYACKVSSGYGVLKGYLEVKSGSIFTDIVPVTGIVKSDTTFSFETYIRDDNKMYLIHASFSAGTWTVTKVEVGTLA